MMHYNNITEKISFEILSSEIGLKPASENDIEYIMAQEQSPENNQYVSNWSKEEHLCTINSTTGKEFIIFDRKNNKAAGFVIILGLNSDDNNILIKRLVITDKNKGLGRKTLELLKKWAFETLHAHRLWLDVKEFNERAKHLYQSTGFILEGKMRESKKEPDGSYSSFYILSILEDEYYSSKQ